jgi:tetratricopeptide (TPR) repeat protein
MLHFQEKRYTQAETDLRRALDVGAEPAVVHYDLALVYEAQGNYAAALESVGQALAHDPKHRDARLLQQRLEK